MPVAARAGAHSPVWAQKSLGQEGRRSVSNCQTREWKWVRDANNSTGCDIRCVVTGEKQMQVAFICMNGRALPLAKRPQVS